MESDWNHVSAALIRVAHQSLSRRGSVHSNSHLSLWSSITGALASRTLSVCNGLYFPGAV